MVTPSRDAVLAKLNALKSGIAGVPSIKLIIASETYGDAELTTRLQRSIDAERTVLALAAQLRDALRVRKGVRRQEHAFLKVLATLLHERYANSEGTLAKFGLRPKKAAPKRTAEQRILMSAKNRATRAKRGTMSKQQKAKIRGEVTGVKLVPVLVSDGEGEGEGEGEGRR